MPFLRNQHIALVGALLAIALCGCGDGSSASPETVPLTPLTPAAAITPQPTPGTAATTEMVLSGIVATGAPCGNVLVSFPDSATAFPTVRTGADGAYKTTLTVLTKDAAKPLLVQAECPNASGGSDTLVSISAARASGTVNVNPLTNLIAALVTKSGDPTRLGIELENGTLAIDAALVQGKTDQVREILLPALGALTLASTFDPIKGVAAANGTGLDRLLDMLNIEITPETDGTSSIAITLKIKSANETDSQPIIRFTNVTPLEVIKLNNQISAVSIGQVQFVASLIIPNDTAGLITDLVQRVNACYALSIPGRGSNTALSPACQAMFLDGSISNFQENGLQGMAALLAPWLGLTSSESPVTALLSTGPAQFSQGTYQFLRPDGVLGFTAVKTAPGETPVATPFEAQVGADGKLGLSGNRYRFQAKMTAFAERRTFLNQKTSDYLSTGIDIVIPVQSKGGVPVTKVVLTPPANAIPGNRATFTLLPGASGMALPVQDERLADTVAPSAGGFLRLRSEYTDTAAGVPRRHPSLRDFAQYFANDMPDSAIKLLSAGDVWSLAFYVGKSSTPDAVQYYRLSARPFTIDEIRSLAVPDLTAPTKAFLQGLLVSNEPGNPGFTPLAGYPSLALPSTRSPAAMEQRVFGLTAPPGATANIFFTDISYLLFGTLGNQIVPCQNGGNGDLHCAPDGSYASGALLNGVELLARLPDRREIAQHFSVLQLLP